MPAYHRVTDRDINPFHGQQLIATTYVLGSPGAGKSALLKRLAKETAGQLVLESGIFDLFQKHVHAYVKAKKEQGITDVTDFFLPGNPFQQDPAFTLPAIDGLDITRCMMSSVPLDKTIEELNANDPNAKRRGKPRFNNLPYGGCGAWHYRESLSLRINSGGKSGYPDWLFYPVQGGYAQAISFPGHHSLKEIMANQSIPEIARADAIIYLIDPLIDAFDHDGINPAKNKAHLHLQDALRLERKGMCVQWILSKTDADNYACNLEKAQRIYGALSTTSNIQNRLMDFTPIDSFTSSAEAILGLLDYAMSRRQQH